MEIGMTNEDFKNDEFTIRLNTYESIIATFNKLREVHENQIALCALNTYDFNVLKFELTQLPKTTIPACNYDFSDMHTDKEIRIMGVRIIGSNWIEKGICKPFTHKEVAQWEQIFNNINNEHS